MATHDELGSVWEEVEEELARRGLPVFPAPLDPANGPLAIWPESGSVGEFLDLAERLDTSLIHAHCARLEPDNLEEFAIRLAEVLSSGAEIVLFEAQQHLGDIHTVQVGFSHEGATLLWIAEAAWYTELLTRVRYEEENAHVVRELEAIPREQEWVRMLARNSDFERATKREQRLRIAFKLIPELEQMRNALDARTRMTADRLVSAASSLYDEEIRPEQERDIARKAQKRLDAGEPKHQVAGSYGMGINKLNRILGQYA